MKICCKYTEWQKYIYGDNIATKKNDYVIIPETIREINVCGMMFSFVSYVIQQAYSEPSLKHYNKAFLLKELTALPGYTFNETAGLTQPVFTCSKSNMQTPEQCVKSVQS